MNVQHYTAAFDQSSWILLACVGLDAAYFRDTSSGMAALEQTVQYKAELRAGDVFEIHSSMLEVREKTMRRRHEMYKSGTCSLAASTTIVGVHLDMNTRKGTNTGTSAATCLEICARRRLTVFGIRDHRPGDEQS